jgi:predicted O-methyltransferase YrrM
MLSKNEIMSRIQNVKGILPGNHAELLIEAVQLSNGICIEIGALAGASTCCIALAMDPQEMLISIDPWKVKYLSEMAKGIVSQVTGPESLKEESFFSAWEKQVLPIVGDRFIHALVGDRLEKLDVIKEYLQGREAGFLFIDGLHHYEAVRDEIIAYLPLLKTGAIVAFHDYSPGWGVFQAVNEAVEDGRLEEVRNDYLFVARKK